MRYSNHIAAIILGGRLSLVLGAQTIEQITLNIQDGQSAIENANDYAQNINAADGTLDYTTIVTNNNNLATSIKGYDSDLEGTPTLTNNDQIELVEATSPFTDAVQNYYGTLANKAGDFLLPSEKSAIADSVDALEDVIDQFFKDLEALGPTVAAPELESQVADDDDGRQTVDADYDVSKA